MHDIYNPPPAPVALEPPQPEPLSITRWDLAYLLGACGGLAVAILGAWKIEPTLGIWVLVGGLFVILESWFSGLTFLRRHPAARPLRRWLVFLAALVPWLIGLGFAVLLMLALFALWDYS